MMTQEELVYKLCIKRSYDLQISLILLRQNNASDEVWILFFIVREPRRQVVDTDKLKLYDIYENFPPKIVKEIKNWFLAPSLNREASEADMKFLRKIKALVALYKD